MMRSEYDQLINTTKVKEHRIIPNEHDAKVVPIRLKVLDTLGL